MWRRADRALHENQFGGSVSDFPYVYRWAKYLGIPVLGGERKGQLCKVLVWAKKNSCLVEFPDGFRAVTSRGALRANKLPRAGS
jgi:hypothetical protein